jgi:1-acyl-sn-glycerol-3-phosphate acyltransferase
VLGLAGIPVRLLVPHRTLPLAQLWARTIMAGLYPLARIHVAVTGSEHLPVQGPALIASQHRSAFDTVVWLTLLPRTAYVVKAELQSIPLFGPLLRPAGQIPVDRGAGAAALRTLLKGADRAVAEGRQIVIFPEGTRVAEGAEVKLQPGVAALASRLGLPVIPAALDSGRCWGRRSFRKRPGTIHIAIRPPLPVGLTRQDLTGALLQAWREGERSFAQPVDNSVG